MTINKSIGELTTLDGSLDKTLKASEQLKDLPQILQKYMLLGNYQIGNAKKFDSHSIFNDIGSIDGFIAQFVNLDEAQQKAFLSLSSFDEGLEDYIENTKNAVQTGEKFNSQLFEQIASQKDGITNGVLNEFMKAGGLKDAKGVLALPNTQDAIALMEDYANHCSDASKTQQLFNAGILEQENGVYKLSQAFLKEISVKQMSTVATVALTAAQKAWNVVAQYGKQLLLSLGVAAVAFIATKIVDYLMNLKTHSEELVATMNDSHDAAEQATKDVEEIQSKIDELNKSLKDAGVKKIEDIVDPAERERLQAINDMLQAQLELKKQLEKDANDKANADTSAVVNDKTEDSIVKSRTVNVSYAEGSANAGTHQVAEKVSKTESLHEYAAALEDTTQKRRDLQVELDQIEASSGKDSEEYANKKKELDALNETFESQKTKVEELSTAVSEQMGNYKTDADSFAQYKDEYVAGTNAMTAATKALANAQDNTGIDTTNLDIFSEKIKQIKNDIDNGDSQQSDWKTFNGLDAFSGMSGEAIINIDKDSSHQTETETAALEKLHKTADENKISFESLIGVFESFGLVQISNSAAADDYADKLEKTMGVIDNIQSAYKACSSAVEEYNQYGYMSVDSLQALLQMDDQYLNTLELVNGKLQVNQSAYADLLATQYAEAQMEAISQAISELNAIAKGDAAEKAETFTEATEDEKNKLTALCPALKDATVGTGELAAALAAAQGAANGEDADAVQAKIDGVMNALNTRLTLIGNNMSAAMNGAAGLRNQLDGFSNSSKKAADSSNKAADSSKTLLDAWSTLTSAMEEYNKWGSISLNTMKSLMGLDSKYTSCLKKQGNELVVDATAWNNKDAEKAIDDQIKKYNEFKDKLSEVMDDIGKSWKDYQKELEYTAQIQKMSLSQMEGSLDGYHNKIIASLNTGSAITGIQNLITNLESLINTLTKLNNLYSMFKTGEYKDLGTKGLWNTIKGFLNNGGEKAASSGTSYVNAAKQAVNAVKTTLVDTATETGTALKNILTTANNNITKQVVSSGNGIINAFTNIWNTIKGGAQSLFGGSGEGGGIVSTVVNGFKAVGNAVSKSKIGSTILGGIGKVGTTLLSGGGKLLAGAGKLIGTAGSALAAAGPAAIPILAAGGLGIYGGTKAMKNQKKIWSNKEDGFGKKAIKSVASFFWDISPIGGIVNLCKDIFGKSKETAENTKDTANSSSETAENTQKSATNLTINATQIVSKEENKATDETDKKNDATANEDKTVKTAATTLTGAGLGAAAGMAVGGPVGALIGTLLGGFAGFFLGGHANGLKSSKTNHFANVDERGSELIVRKPASGRYTYLETGDGVVPADITSRLFEMGGNPDKWFSDQLAKHSSASMVQSRDAGGISLSIGDVNVNNPVGDSDALARELVNRLPNKVVQELNRR